MLIIKSLDGGLRLLKPLPPTTSTGKGGVFVEAGRERWWGMGGPSRGGVNKSFTLFNITDLTEYCRFNSFSCILYRLLYERTKRSSDILLKKSCAGISVRAGD